MKILMINPPEEYTVFENASEESLAFIDGDDFGKFPPLGMLYVMSYLENNTSGHVLSFIDCVAEKVKYGTLSDRVADFAPDVVGITSFTTALVDVCRTAETCREVSPDAHICMGGHHPISFPIEAAELPQFDSVVVGEGEHAFTDLINALDKGEDITSILGVYTCESIQKYKNIEMERDRRFLPGVNVPAAYVEEVDDLPIPNRKFIREISYHSIVGVGDKLATIITSRGCPYLCTFCNVPYKKYRERNPDLIMDEVQECLDMGYNEFHFYDDLFNVNEQKVIDFCEAIERRNMKFVWDFRGRVSAVTYESLKMAKKNGLRQISFGVETGSDEGLKILRKQASTEKTSNAFKWCRELGIRSVADYMIGLPFEKSMDDVRRNIDYLIQLDPDFAQISILCLCPNTQIYDEAIEKGLIDGDRWRKFIQNPIPGFVFDHWNEFLSEKNLADLHKESYRKFYLRPLFVIRNIFQTRTLYEFKAKMKGLFKLTIRGLMKREFSMPPT